MNQNTSKLLIDEPPLQLLPTLAEIVGLNHAIVLQQIHYWLRLQTPDGRRMGTEADGQRWIRNTAQDWQSTNFPFWSVNTVRRILEKLEKDKLLKVRDDLNKAGFDHTKWYTIDYEQLATIYPKWVNRITQNGQPQIPKMGNAIPETTRDKPKIPLGSATPTGGIYLEPVGSHETDPFKKQDFQSKYSDNKYHQQYGGFMRFHRDGDPDFQDPRLYHPALRLYRGIFQQDVTPKSNWRDRIIRAVGESKSSLETWRKSCDIWSGTSENPNAPARVLSIFENGGVLNDIDDFKRQQNGETQDNEVQLKDPLSMKNLTKRVEGWKELKDSGVLERKLKPRLEGAD